MTTITAPAEIADISHLFVTLANIFYSRLTNITPQIDRIVRSRKFFFFKDTTRCPVCIEIASCYKILDKNGELPGLKQKEWLYRLDEKRKLVREPRFSICRYKHATVYYQVMDTSAKDRVTSEIDTYQITLNDSLQLMDHKSQFCYCARESYFG